MTEPGAVCSRNPKTEWEDDKGRGARQTISHNKHLIIIFTFELWISRDEIYVYDSQFNPVGQTRSSTEHKQPLKSPFSPLIGLSEALPALNTHQIHSTHPSVRIIIQIHRRTRTSGNLIFTGTPSCFPRAGQTQASDPCRPGGHTQTIPHKNTRTVVRTHSVMWQ